jgi:hypothetical protein
MVDVNGSSGHAGCLEGDDDDDATERTHGAFISPSFPSWTPPPSGDLEPNGCDALGGCTETVSSSIDFPDTPVLGWRLPAGWDHRGALLRMLVALVWVKLAGSGALPVGRSPRTWVRRR